MSSASSPVKQAIADYVAGRVKPDRLVAAVAAAYYGKSGTAGRGPLQPLIEVIERAAPGVVELAGREGGTGFELKLAERPFPKQYEVELQRAAEAALAALAAEPVRDVEGSKPRSGFLTRVRLTVLRIFG